MRTVTWLSLLLSAVAWSFASTAADPPLSPAAQVGQMARGVNIVSDDPLWEDPARARFQPRLMATIREGGFDTVRIVLHGFDHMDAHDRLAKQWLGTLDGLVQAALAQGFTVVLDEHDFTFCGLEPELCRRKLLAFWRQVGELYADAPSRVVFEILNEPNGRLNAHWNDLLAEALAVIRERNPQRNVIVGPMFWNDIGSLDKLALPEDDRHLIVTVHYYQPMRFTHQGTSWTNNRTLGITWGSAEDRAALDEDFDRAQAWSVAHGRPIFLGEFGAYEKAPMESRVAYVAAAARAAERRGWAWAYWQFDGDFIVYDIAKDAWVEPIHRALVPREGTAPR